MANTRLLQLRLRYLGSSRSCRGKKEGKGGGRMTGAPALSVDAADLDVEVLLLTFRRSLDEVHRSWRPTLLRVSRKLLKSILGRSPTVEDRASVPYLFLPGLVAEVHRSKKVSAGRLLHGLASWCIPWIRILPSPTVS